MLRLLVVLRDEYPAIFCLENVHCSRTAVVWFSDYGFDKRWTSDGSIKVIKQITNGSSVNK